MTTQDIQCYYKDKRQENRKTIFHFMLDGKEYTKQQVSVGVLYQINDKHECYLAVHFYIVKKQRWVESIVFSVTGNVLAKNTKEYELVNYERIEELIAALIQQYPHIIQIVIGTPSIAQFEIVVNFDEYYYEGMYQMALEKKEFN